MVAIKKTSKITLSRFIERISKYHSLSPRTFWRSSLEGSYLQFHPLSFHYLRLPNYFLTIMRRDILHPSMDETLDKYRSSPTRQKIQLVDPVLASRRQLVKLEQSKSNQNRMNTRFLNEVTGLGVSIHTGPLARRITKIYGAKALTIGRHVFFAEGMFNPDSPEGFSLLAHELTHVLQQERISRREKRGEISPGRRGELETEAQASEQAVLKELVPLKVPASILSTLVRSTPTQFPLERRVVNAKRTMERMQLKSINPLSPIHTHPQLREGPTFNGVSPQSKHLELSMAFNPSAISFPSQPGGPKHFELPLVQASPRTTGNVQLTEAQPPNTYPPTPEMTHAPEALAQSQVDIESVAERVYNILVKRIKMEKERRGYR